MINTDKILDAMKESFYKLSSQKLLIIFAILWVFICIVLIYYSYNTYIKPLISSHKLNGEFVNSNHDNSDDIVIMYFYTEWCPYCKKAKPELSKFQTYIDKKKTTLDYNITLVRVNCDESKDIANKYKIEGYPTVKGKYKNKIYDFDAKVTSDNLIEFLKSIN
tara:strand:+ start:660 stop:1148 length:489 start_codon:yes stop_codon:yes gene_type:complete